MKGNGFLELIFIMVFMVAGIPLMVQTVKTMEADKMTYLDDKSIYQLPTVLDVTNVNGETVIWAGGTDYNHTTLNTAGVVLIAAVQDDYCPTDGYIVRYPNDLLTGSNVDLTISKGWRGLKYNRLSDILNQLPPSYRDSNSKATYAMVWNPDYFNGDLEGRWELIRIK